MKPDEVPITERVKALQDLILKDMTEIDNQIEVLQQNYKRRLESANEFLNKLLKGGIKK